MKNKIDRIIDEIKDWDIVDLKELELEIFMLRADKKYKPK